MSFSWTQRRATASGVEPRFRNLSITSPMIFDHTASITVRASCAGGLEFKSQTVQTQRLKRFATASTSTQVAVLPWHYDADSLHASAYNKRVWLWIFNHKYNF